MKRKVATSPSFSLMRANRYSAGLFGYIRLSGARMNGSCGRSAEKSIGGKFNDSWMLQTSRFGKSTSSPVVTLKAWIAACPRRHTHRRYIVSPSKDA